MQRVEDALTKLYGRLRGGITDIEEYRVGDHTQKVYWFDDGSLRLGDYSPVGTVLVNEAARDDFSDSVTDFVVLHESGHDQFGFIGRTIFWALYLTFGLVLIAGILASPMYIAEVLSVTWNPFYVLSAIAVYAVIAVVPFMTVCWVDEGHAELFAISELGVDRYEAVREEMREDFEPSILHRLRTRIQYPPQWLIIKIARWRDQ